MHGATCGWSSLGLHAMTDVVTVRDDVLYPTGEVVRPSWRLSTCSTSPLVHTVATHAPRCTPSTVTQGLSQSSLRNTTFAYLRARDGRNDLGPGMTLNLQSTGKVVGHGENRYSATLSRPPEARRVRAVAVLCCCTDAAAVAAGLREGRKVGWPEAVDE